MRVGKEQKVVSGLMSVVLAGSTITTLPVRADGSLIEAEQDSYVSLEMENRQKNYGAQKELILENSGETIAGNAEQKNCVAYLKFPIGKIDPKNVQDISLKLKVVENKDNAGVNVYSAESDWKESEINWENQPGLGEKIGDETLIADGEIVVTGLKEAVLKALEEGKEEITLAVCIDSEAMIKFESRESDNAPALKLITMEETIALDPEKEEDGEIEWATPDIMAMVTTISDDELAEVAPVVNQIEELYGQNLTDYSKELPSYTYTPRNYPNLKNITDENYTEYWKAISTIRTDFEALNNVQRGAVGLANATLLESAENKYQDKLDKDIAKVKDAVDGIPVKPAEVVGKGIDGIKLWEKTYVAARKTYDDFAARQGRTEDTEKTQQALDAVVDERATLDEYETEMNNLFEKIVEDFKDATNATFDYEMTFGEYELPKPYVYNGKNYIWSFVDQASYDKFLNIEEYIKNGNAIYDKLKDSELYEDFVKTDGAKEALKKFLKESYMYETDKLQMMYGDIYDDNGNIDYEKLRNRFFDEYDKWDLSNNIIYTYIKEQATESEKILLRLKELDGISGKDQVIQTNNLTKYEKYNKDLYEAMQNVVGQAVKEMQRAIMRLTENRGRDSEGNNLTFPKDGKGLTVTSLLDEDEITWERKYNANDPYNEADDDAYGYIISDVAYALKTYGLFKQALLDYLSIYQPDDYNALFDTSDGYANMHTLIADAESKLRKLIEDEYNKYDGLEDEIEDYGLNYKSGYKREFGEDEDQDPDEFITNIGTGKGNVKLQMVIDFYKLVDNDSNADAKYNSGDLDNAILKFNTKLAAIKKLRAASKEATDAYDGFVKYFTWADLVAELGTENPVKHEDVVAAIDSLIGKYNTAHPDATIDLTTVMTAFDTLRDKFTAYNTEIGKYKGNYSEDNFDYPTIEVFTKDGTSLLYMTKDQKDDIEKLQAVIYKHIDMSDFMMKVATLHTTVNGFAAQKEALYEANDGFSSVNTAKTTFMSYETEYAGFTAEQLYCIKSETEQQMAEMKTTLSNWDKAIAVMNAIDKLDTATEDNFDDVLVAANKAYEEASAPVLNLIAEAAKNKLNFYNAFGTVRTQILALPVIISQHQIKDYEQKIIDARNDFEALFITYSIAKENLNSNLVNNTEKVLEDREFEMSCAKAARDIDMEIVNLESYDLNDEAQLEEYLNAFTAVERKIEALVTPTEGNERPANMTFGMLLQYSRFMHHREDIDEIWIARFENAVNAIGTIDYTSDFEKKEELIGKADDVYTGMKARMQKDPRSKAAKAKLEQLRADLARCKKAKADAAETKEKLESFGDEIDAFLNIVYKPESEEKYENDIVPGIVRIDGILNALKNGSDDDKNAYDYLVANDIIDDYNLKEAKVLDKMFYYQTQKDIDELWAEAQQAHKDGTLLDSRKVKEVEDNYKALSVIKSGYSSDYGRTQQELVENYSKLAWVRMQIEENRTEYVDQLKAEMDEKGLMSIDADTLSVKDFAKLIAAEGYYDAMSEETKELFKDTYADYDEQLKALTKAHADLKKLYETRGGKAGDVDEDGKVTIRDIVMIVDYALDNGIEPEDNAQFLRADIVHPENDEEDSAIDVNDVIAGIGLIEF